MKCHHHVYSSYDLLGALVDGSPIDRHGTLTRAREVGLLAKGSVVVRDGRLMYGREANPLAEGPVADLDGSPTLGRRASSSEGGHGGNVNLDLIVGRVVLVVAVDCDIVVVHVVGCNAVVVHVVCCGAVVTIVVVVTVRYVAPLCDVGTYCSIFAFFSGTGSFLPLPLLLSESDIFLHV